MERRGGEEVFDHGARVRFDMVMIDVQMSGIDGIEVIQSIQEREAAEST